MLRLYVLRQLLVSLAIAVGGMSFVALPGIAVAAMQKLPNADTVILFQYVPIVLQNLAPYVLPIGFLLAVVATYGRLAADNEWTAIQMAGFHPLSMLLPGLVVAAVLGSGSYWLLSQELPNLKKREKQYIVDAARHSIMNLAPGRTDVQFGTFYLNAALLDGDVLRDVYIHKPALDEGEEDVRAFADTARIRDLGDVWTIDLTGVSPVDPVTGIAGRVEELSVVLPISRFMDASVRRYNHARYQTSSGLRAALDGGDLDAEHRIVFRYEIHNRIAMSCVVLMFLGLGAPTGLILRRGTQLGALAVSVGYALVYYLLSMRLGKELVREEIVAPAVGAWLAFSLGIVASVLLLARAVKR